MAKPGAPPSGGDKPPKEGGSKVKLYATGNRKNLRVRIAGVKRDETFILRFGPNSDPCGYTVNDPAGGKYRVEVKGGEGVMENIDLSAYPQFTKVGIFIDGDETSIDIPNEEPVPTTAAPTPTKAGKPTQIKTVVEGSIPDDLKKPAKLTCTVAVYVKDSEGNPATSPIRVNITGRTLPRNETAMDGRYEEQIEVKQGETELKYRASLPTGESSEVDLPAPPKPECKGSPRSFREGLNRWRNP